MKMILDKHCCGLENMKREQDLSTLFKKYLAKSGNM